MKDRVTPHKSDIRWQLPRAVNGGSPGGVPLRSIAQAFGGDVLSPEGSKASLYFGTWPELGFHVFCNYFPFVLLVII